MAILILIITLFSLKAFCPSERVLYIERPAQISYYEPLIVAIVWVESSGYELALNVKEQAVGPMQIRQCRIDHYNQLTKSNYKIEDCFDYELSRKVFLYFAQGKSYEWAARSWNGSGPMTIKYWNRVKANL